MPLKHSRRMDNLLDSVDAQLMVADPAERLMDSSLRVDYIPADLVRPDPVQPRRVLPEAIHIAFHEDRLTPVQALRELIQIAQVAARQHGRPFNNPLELLAGLESDEEGERPRLSPEEVLVRDLVNLAVTIRDDGQVNPLTVVDLSQGVTRQYRIETGERRYWATWLLREFLPGYEADGTIPCIIILSGKASVFRQAKENTARSGLSAIAMARQAALLILAVHEIEKPDTPVSNDFYRQALQLDLRDKRDSTEGILASMGGITKSRLSQYKALLQLSDDALEMADRYSVDEGRLRHVLNFKTDDQAEMVRQIIQFNLSSKQVKDMCSQGGPEHKNDEPPIPKSTRQLVRLARTLDPTSGRVFVRALLDQEQDKQVAQAHLQRLKQFLAEAEQYLTEQ